MKYQKPSFTEERLLWEKGYRYIAGVDEVGRGALMGPVVAAAVILPEDFKAEWKSRVQDSKRLTPGTREYLFGLIKEKAISCGIGFSSSDVIDLIGISKATRLAMFEAIRQLIPQPNFLLIDYVRLVETSLPQKGIKHGDSLCFSIACASIIAKVTRDRMVTEMDREFPGYGFASHKGYGTEKHIRCLNEKGPCKLHRKSFNPVKELVGIKP